MANSFLYEPSGECTTLTSHSVEICFQRTFCNATCTDWLLTACDDIWNCDICQEDQCYLQPYIVGDLINFQTRFADLVNVDETAPTQGWGQLLQVELVDCLGNVISQNHNDFSTEFVVGWNESGGYSYQNIIVDTALISGLGLDSFSLCFTPYDTDGVTLLTDRALCTQQFGEIATDCGVETLVICSSHSDEDCCGNYYGIGDTFAGTSNFAYSNCIRYFARITDTGASWQKEVIGTKRTEVEIDCIFTLSMLRPIPPFAKNMLVKQHLAGETTTIDGVAYEFDSGTIENRLSNGTMYMFQVNGVQSCDKNFRCG